MRSGVVTASLLALSLPMGACDQITAQIAPPTVLPSDPIERGAICMVANTLAGKAGQVTEEETRTYGDKGGFMQIAGLSAIADDKFSDEQFEAVSAAFDKMPKQIEMQTKKNSKQTLESCWKLYPSMQKKAVNISELDKNINLGCLDLLNTFDNKNLSDAVIARTTAALNTALSDKSPEEIGDYRDRLSAMLLRNGLLADNVAQCQALLSE